MCRSGWPSSFPVEMHGFRVPAVPLRYKVSPSDAKKLLPGLYRANIPFRLKAEGALHLNSNSSYTLIVIVVGADAARNDRALLYGRRGKWSLLDLTLIVASFWRARALLSNAQRELHPKTEGTLPLAYVMAVRSRSHR